MTFHPDVDDSEIAWAIQLYNSREQIQWCLGLLRASYSKSRIVLINDGDGEDYSDIASRYRCTYVSGEHLHTLQTCHLYVERLLRALSEGDESYHFKIDPDTAVWRRFGVLPAFSCMFGTLETITEGRLAEIEGPPNVQGGCIGMTSDVTTALLSSNVLTRDACARDAGGTWARCDDMLRTAAGGQFCDDFVLSWAADKAGLAIVSHAEVKSRWRRRVARLPGHAVTHPHKCQRWPKV